MQLMGGMRGKRRELTAVGERLSMSIRFYSTRDPFGEFSNFAPFPIEIDGQSWPTTEHYYQAQKFDDPAYREQIRAAASPMIAAKLGRSRKVPLRDDWEQVRDEVMHRAVAAKFRTHAALRDLLLSTGDHLIVEDSPTDSYWGCGADGNGRNMLGVILMRVRAELRGEGAVHE
jgi:N-glycosidase YbiA